MIEMSKGNKAATLAANKNEIPTQLDGLSDTVTNVLDVTRTLVEKFNPVLSGSLCEEEMSTPIPELVPVAHELYRINDRLLEALRVLRYMNNNCQL
jgi:hypothetical protein